MTSSLKFTVRPPRADYKEALENRAVSYSRLTHNLNLLRGRVASGYPFVFGFTVYESFESQAVAELGVVRCLRLRRRRLEAMLCLQSVMTIAHSGLSFGILGVLDGDERLFYDALRLCYGCKPGR